MSERRTAQIVGVVLGLIFAAALILNALAAYSIITPSNHRTIADPPSPPPALIRQRRAPHSGL